VRTAMVHYLLMVLTALLIVLGTPVVGTVLVTALLVLPGATGLIVSQRLRTVLVTAIGVAVVGATVGVMLNLRWRFVPVGPAIVLGMFVEFLVCYAISQWRSVGTSG
jgi:ABC-type Mn2+/Zn2+ transport system permease subunit